MNTYRLKNILYKSPVSTTKLQITDCLTVASSVVGNIQTAVLRNEYLKKSPTNSNVILTGLAGLPKKRKCLLLKFSVGSARGICGKTKKRLGSRENNGKKSKIN